MSLDHFLRIERDEGDGSRHLVVHLQDPSFSLELAPDEAASDRIGQGVIKRICVPNSWAGDYGKYAQFVGQAQEFFARSFGESEPKAGVRRFSV